MHLYAASTSNHQRWSDTAGGGLTPVGSNYELQNVVKVCMNRTVKVSSKAAGLWPRLVGDRAVRS